MLIAFTFGVLGFAIAKIFPGKTEKEKAINLLLSLKKIIITKFSSLDVETLINSDFGYPQ